MYEKKVRTKSKIPFTVDLLQPRNCKIDHSKLELFEYVGELELFIEQNPFVNQRRLWRDVCRNL